MAKTYIGIDIGTGHIKLAVCNENGVQQAAMEDVPENLVKDGRITSFETMSDLLREAVRKHKITAKDCALTLHSREAFTRRITVPAMTIEELTLNLPFEFKDYIADDKDKYSFDYAVLNFRRDEAGNPLDMDLLASAAPTATIEAYDLMLHRAGLKLRIAAPDIMAYTNIIAAYEKRVGRGPVGQTNGMPESDTTIEPAHKRDFCFLDIGSRNTRVYLFPKGTYEVTRSIEFGTLTLVEAIADHFSVDLNLARTYLANNYEDAQNIPPCLNLYERLGIEVARIVSFFNFNYPESQLDTLHYCGTGSYIPPLLASLDEHTSIEILDMGTIMPPSQIPANNLRMCPAAVGIALQ